MAQKTKRYTPIFQKGWYLSFNPFSIVEPEQGGVGLGVGYRIDKHFEVWTKLNYLYHSKVEEISEFDNLKGFRSITSLKYYYNQKHAFFGGGEFRVKYYAFDDKTDFINIQTNDTLHSFPNKASHTLIGGAAFWGMRIKVSRNGKFEYEANVGFGGKSRTINRKNVPAGYTRINDYPKPHYHRPDHNIEDTQVYIPATVRLIYHL